MSLRKAAKAPVAAYRGPGAGADPKDTDPYAVLSMHQPWASLLVYGIKRIEGRGWPTQHRGRLWIHATSQQPSVADIQELEAFYTEVHAAERRLPIFPQSYPTSALLGCVDVTDCLPAEELQAWPGLPEGLKMEALSPQAWLCEAPRRLVVPQRMPGAPRIWTLPRAKLDPLSRGLKEPPGLIPFSWADMPPRIGPAVNPGGNIGGADSQPQAKRRQHPQQAEQDGTENQPERQKPAAAPSADAAGAQPSPPADGQPAVGVSPSGGASGKHASSTAERPAKRTLSWAQLASRD